MRVSEDYELKSSHAHLASHCVEQRDHALHIGRAEGGVHQLALPPVRLPGDRQ